MNDLIFTFVIKTQSFKPLSIDGKESTCHNRSCMRCPHIWFLLDSFFRQLVPFKHHVPIDQAEEIFWNKFVVKCGVTDVVNLGTYNYLKRSEILSKAIYIPGTKFTFIKSIKYFFLFQPLLFLAFPVWEKRNQTLMQDF